MLTYESQENEDLFLDQLSTLHTIVDSLDSSCITIVGDFNSNVSNENSIFSHHLDTFCTMYEYTWSSKNHLPPDTFTYISDAWGSTSWLDHCITSSDCDNIIKNMYVLQDIYESDHLPLVTEFDLTMIPAVNRDSSSSNNPGKINWDSISEVNKLRYSELSESLFDQIPLPHSALTCTDSKCNINSHKEDLDKFYGNIVNVITKSSEWAFGSQNKNIKGFNRPGWNDHCKDLHNIAREAYFNWLDCGKPRHGNVFYLKNSTKARFKGALRFINTNKENIKSDKLAEKLLQKDDKAFWKEVRSQNNNNNIGLPEVVDNIQGTENIANMWKEHYTNLFNCLNNSSSNNTADLNVNSFDYNISPEAIATAIAKLNLNKSSGPDTIQAEHLKLCHSKINILLSLCFTSCIKHNSLPIDMLSVVIIPVVKNKSKGIGDKSNYRPIALSNILSKVIESAIYDHIQMYIITSDNQFGFKKAHGTDLCIYALKETILRYNYSNSNVYSCFLDASKAFDRVNHIKLFKKLFDLGIPNYIINILSFWYSNQNLFIKWGNFTTESFKVTNGVRQGSILSPYLFCIYMNDLSNKLNQVNVGCLIGKEKVNHFLYADDIALISPTSSGLQKLIKICEEYGVENDLIFNSAKSFILIFECNLFKKCDTPSFYLNNNLIPIDKSCKYLGHFICSDLRDHSDMDRQRKRLYVQGNMIKRNFDKCTESVKVKLFRTYCTSLYTPHLWWKYSGNKLNQLYVAYNNSFRIIIRQPPWCSASHMFVTRKVPSCKEIIRKLTLKFLYRIHNSNNSIIRAITNSDWMYHSPFYKKMINVTHSITL